MILVLSLAWMLVSAKSLQIAKAVRSGSSAPLGAVWYFRDGKVARVQSFFSHDERLSAGGVEDA